MDNDNPQVQIAVIHTDLGYVKKSVDSIEKKLDEQNKIYATKEEVAAIQKDVSSLIRWKYYFTGAAAAIAVLVSKVADIITSYLGGHH